MQAVHYIKITDSTFVEWKKKKKKKEKRNPVHGMKKIPVSQTSLSTFEHKKVTAEVSSHILFKYDPSSLGSTGCTA